ncbi:MAG TPA: hypothetical protein VG944_21270 [Fimbriimonas sp.]|nr:hypothetical protein [Fimbriimonas sp.]
MKSAVAAVAMLWLSGVLESSLSPRLAIGYGSPDFPLIVLVCLGLFCDRRATTLLGFGAGLVQGAVAGANLTLYIATRSVAGFLLGWFNQLEVQGNLLVAGLVCFVVSLGAQLLLMFLGVYHGSLPPFLAGTLITAVYNGVIAMPVYALLNKLARSTR